MKGNRLSLLDQGRYCGQAPILSESHGASRWATISKAFHATCAGDPAAADQVALLDTKEREEFERLHRPTETEVKGVVLRYADAETEVPVGLGWDGEWLAYDDPERMTQGTLDIAWSVEDDWGRRVAFVADIKLAEWTKSADPDSLQLTGYCLAYADRISADYYCPGIFHATQGTWRWGHVTPTMGRTSARKLKELRAAVKNLGSDYVTGAHCRDCYARMQCPEHMLPAMDPQNPMASLASENPTEAAMLEALLHAQRLEEAAKKLKETAQEFVRRNGPIHDPTSGKRYMLTECQGRESFDKKALEREYGKKLIARFTKRGAPYDRFIWVK